MSDEECVVIECQAIGHLIRCGLDDFNLGVVDLKGMFEYYIGEIKL